MKQDQHFGRSDLLEALGPPSGATPSSASGVAEERSASATPASEGSVHGRQTLQVQGAGNIQVESILQNRRCLGHCAVKTGIKPGGRAVAVRFKVTVTAEHIDGSAPRGTDPEAPCDSKPVGLTRQQHMYRNIPFLVTPNL